MEKDMKVLDLKTAMALSFSRITNLKTEQVDISNNNIIFLTAAGTICGTYIEDLSSSEDLYNSVFASATKNAEQFIYPSETSIPIFLKDVTLITQNGLKQSFETLCVFPSDIIAITIGR